MRDDRDFDLGSAVGSLPVPEHRPGRSTDLERRLEDGRTTREPAPRRLRRPGRGPSLWLAVAAMAALVVGTVTVLTRGDGNGQVVAGPGTKPPAQPDRLVVRGRMVAGSGSFDFALDDRGNSRIAFDGGHVTTFDAEERVWREVLPSSDGSGPLYLRNEGVGAEDPGFFDAEPALDLDLGWTVAARAAARDPQVTDTEYEGRPAWRWRTAAPPNPSAGLAARRLEVVVDKETKLPVRVVEGTDGGEGVERHVEGLRVDKGGIDPAELDVIPAGAEAKVHTGGDRRYRSVDDGDVATLLGYTPYRPSFVPRGFRPVLVAVNPDGAASGSEASNPQAGPLLTLQYRRGFESITITVRPAGDDPSAWIDPLLGEGQEVQPQAVTIRGGAFRGARAERMVAAVTPATPPHLWLISDGLVVTVSGTLSGDELVKVAESLVAVG